MTREFYDCVDVYYTVLLTVVTMLYVRFAELIHPVPFDIDTHLSIFPTFQPLVVTILLSASKRLCVCVCVCVRARARKVTSVMSYSLQPYGL